MSGKTPDVGDRIEHYLPHIDVARQGVVVYLLTSSFCYELDSGATWLCGFTEDWKYVSI